MLPSTGWAPSALAFFLCSASTHHQVEVSPACVPHAPSLSRIHETLSLAGPFSLAPHEPQQLQPENSRKPTQKASWKPPPPLHHPQSDHPGFLCQAMLRGVPVAQSLRPEGLLCPQLCCLPCQEPGAHCADASTHTCAPHSYPTGMHTTRSRPGRSHLRLPPHPCPTSTLAPAVHHAARALCPARTMLLGVSPGAPMERAALMSTNPGAPCSPLASRALPLPITATPWEVASVVPQHLPCPPYASSPSDTCLH